MLEGVGFNLRWIFENFKRDFNFNPQSIRATGGGSVNDQWIQGIANITGKTVETTSQPTMAGAMGAAACAFIGNGTYSGFKEMCRLLEVNSRFIPDPELYSMYSELFSSYKDIYKDLRKAYIKANLKRFNQ